MATERRCNATTKNGQPCRAKPLRDQDVCLAHADEEARISMGFGVGSGRPKKPRVVDVLRERIEARIDEWLQPLDDALTAERAVVVGSGDSAEVEMVADHAIRLRAFAEAMDRVYGKPKQQTEVSGPDGGALEVVSVDASGDHAAEVARILARTHAVSTNGDGGNGHHP